MVGFREVGRMGGWGDRRRRAGAVWRVAWSLVVLWLAWLAYLGAPQAAAQDAQTLAHTVTVTSDVPGAVVWVKVGPTLTCTNVQTPGTVELKFHGANDLQRIRLRRFGYRSQNLDIKPTDGKVTVALGGGWAPDSFLVSSDAKPELKALNDGLKVEFQRTIFDDPEAFRCVPFELSFVQVMDDEGTLTLGVAVVLDRDFGGAAFRVASHTGGRDQRRQKLAQAALEGGIAGLFARLHRIAAKFPNLKTVTVVCSFPTMEAFLDTITTPSVFHSHTTQTQTFGLGADGMMHQTGTVFHTVEGWSRGGEYTVIKDRAVERLIKFAMPAAQIPDTTDHKTLTDAVMTTGRISLGEQGGDSD